MYSVMNSVTNRAHVYKRRPLLWGCEHCRPHVDWSAQPWIVNHPTMGIQEFPAWAFQSALTFARQRPMLMNTS